jgi:hypothetical protein
MLGLLGAEVLRLSFSGRENVRLASFTPKTQAKGPTRTIF